MKLKLNPIQETALFLSVYASTAIAFVPQPNVFIHLGATVGFSLILFEFYRRVFNKNKNRLNTLISALILFLVLHYPTTPLDFSHTSSLMPLIYPLCATFFIVTFKFFLERKGSPLINPVVVGLLVLALIHALFPQSPTVFTSWWGASFQGWISLTLIVLWAIVGLRKWRKYAILSSFLVTYAATLWIATRDTELLRFVVTDATIYFFAAVMLIEPKTSPIKRSDQIAYGLFVAFGMVAYTVFNIAYLDLLSLAAANVIFFSLKTWRNRSLISPKMA